MANQTALIQREVLRCDHCSLVQFHTANALCRRCHKSLEVELQEPEVARAGSVSAQLTKDDIRVDRAVRKLRKLRKLTQRELAAGACVPRSYITKIENGRVLPTLSLLNRLASALGVHIAVLMRDSRTLSKIGITADPFLVEIAAYTSQLDALQRSIFLNHVRELAAHRRSRGSSHVADVRTRLLDDVRGGG